MSYKNNFGGGGIPGIASLRVTGFTFPVDVEPKVQVVIKESAPRKVRVKVKAEKVK